jgi:two-component system, LytTR family, sensor histidine kinase AlgZ
MIEPRDSSVPVSAPDDGDEDPRGPTTLPRELIYFYLVAPILLTPVFQRNIFELAPGSILRAVAGNFVPFLFIPIAIHLVHRFVLPRLWPPARTLLGRLAAHAIVSGLVAAGVAIALHPFFLLVSNGRTPRSGFLSSCVILTWMFILPALVVQELRDRAEAIGRRLAAARQATLRAQLEAIQSRTNPHFLFNALNTVASLVRDEPDLAERTIEHLADFLRYALQSGRLAAVPLGREIAMLEDYLEVQRARFGDRLAYTIEVEPGLAEVMLPPLLLQPLVENAVLHGVANGADVTLAATNAATLTATTTAAASVSIDATGAAHVHLAGAGARLVVDASEAATVTSDVAGEAAEITANGAAVITLHASKSVRIRASGASVVTVHGDPEARDVESSGQASVVFAE